MARPEPTEAECKEALLVIRDVMGVSWIKHTLREARIEAWMAEGMSRQDAEHYAKEVGA